MKTRYLVLMCVCLTISLILMGVVVNAILTPSQEIQLARAQFLIEAQYGDSLTRADRLEIARQMFLIKASN